MCNECAKLAGFCGFEIKLQKGVDRLRHPPYMPGHRNGAADKIGNNGLVANIHGQQSPEIEIGVPWLSALFRRWLFDIVGFR